MPKNKSRKPKQKASESHESNEKKFEKQVKQFGEEAEALGKRIGKKVEQKSDACCCARGSFGAAGLILSIILGILGLAIGIWALEILAQITGSAIIYALDDFLFLNVDAFILIFLFSSILIYLSRCCRSGYILISPISAAFGIAVFLWIAASTVTIVDADIGNPVLLRIAEYVPNHLWAIFLSFLIVGYFFMMLRLLFGRVSKCKCEEVRSHTAPESAEIPLDGPKRLYRSGKDKILGGVCGGIAEYIGVDPVLIRLIWVIFAFAGGSGVMLYIIVWIIIPRNPNHAWKN